MCIFGYTQYAGILQFARLMNIIHNFLLVMFLQSCFKIIQNNCSKISRCSVRKFGERERDLVRLSTVHLTTPHQKGLHDGVAYLDIHFHPDGGVPGDGTQD